MSKLRLPSPAKINLFLKVLNRREDGYHNLQTLFHFLDFMDWLEFEHAESPDITLTCSDKSLVNDNNLVLRAANAMLAEAEASGKKPESGVNIHLEKHLPQGGGIGGGSSNAATCILALDKLWNLEIPKDRLMEIGLSLGADVPLFILGESALGEGRGEQLKSMEIPEFYYILAKPACSVSTANVFQHQELTRDSSPRTIRAFPKGPQAFEALLELVSIGNDCQILVRKLYPEVDQTITLLSEFGPAQLTGTGACVFVPFETQDSAESAYSALQENPTLEQIKLVEGLNHSPLNELI